MALLHKIKPKFWDHHDPPEDNRNKRFTFRRKWKLLILLTTLVAVIPLILMTLLNLHEARRAVQAEIMARTRQQVATAVQIMPHILRQQPNDLDMQLLADFFADLELGPGGDAFIIDGSGILKTPSRYHGELQAPVILPMPINSLAAVDNLPHVQTYTDSRGASMLLGYAGISNTSLILVAIKNQTELLAPWRRMRLKLAGFTGASILLILVVILGMATFLVHRIHEADRKRTEAVRRMAYNNKMASIGRLSAGVAHELNNPLEIINDKAGLIQDMFRFLPHYAADPKLNGLLADIQANIQRCGQITHRLLNLAKGSGHRIETIDIGTVTRETLAFLEQDAAYRNIDINRAIPDQLPAVTCDRGNLQQVLLNLFNHAFQALPEGGRLDVTLTPINGDHIGIEIANSGPAMPEKDLAHVFDPFYFTQTDDEGAGLGLSVTYGLIRQMDARIHVRSKTGEGNRFTIELPLAPKQAAP